jgi:hypothetical protein
MTARSHLLAAFFVSALNLRAAETLGAVGGAAKVDEASASTMPPAIQVVILMSLQYFIVYSLLQILQTYNQMRTPGLKGEWERIFTEAALEVDFGPMLGVLFLAVRMRAQQLWPPDGMVPAESQTWMYFCCLGIAIKCFVVIVEPWLTGSVRMDGLDKNDPLVAEQRRQGGARFMFASACGILRTLATFFVYVGFTVVIFTIYELPAKPGSGVCTTCNWAYSPAVAPAVQCVINLTVQYFTIFGLLMAAKLYSTFFYKGRKTFSIRTLESAVPSLKLCPMLAILFIGARMRALQMKLDSPPAWAQLSFYVATYAILVQTICAVLTPILTGEARAELDEDGNVVTTGATGGGAATVITLVRYLALSLMIAGVVFSGYSVFAMEAPPPGETPPVSTTIRCVLNLTAQFLSITILYTMAQSYSQLVLGGVRTDFQQVLSAAMPTLQFIPMLCVLFVAVRMRALQLDPADGAPQSWVQEAMVMTTWAMLVQTVVALALPFTTGELEGVMIDSPAVANILVIIKFIGLGVTYAGIATTIYGVCLL